MVVNVIIKWKYCLVEDIFVIECEEFSMKLEDIDMNFEVFIVWKCVVVVVYCKDKVCKFCCISFEFMFE